MKTRWAVYTLHAETPDDAIPPMELADIWTYRGDWSSFEKANKRAARFRAENAFAGLRSGWSSMDFPIELQGPPPIILLWLPDPDVEPSEVPW
jgi:hypothetical protein